MTRRCGRCCGTGSSGGGSAGSRRRAGERAPPLAQGARFDVVILDKEMPGLGGFDVLPAFRRQRPDVPVILVTAFGGALVAEEALKLGAEQYRAKPFQFPGVVAA